MTPQALAILRARYLGKMPNASPDVVGDVVELLGEVERLSSALAHAEWNAKSLRIHLGYLRDNKRHELANAREDLQVDIDAIVGREETLKRDRDAARARVAELEAAFEGASDEATAIIWPRKRPSPKEVGTFVRDRIVACVKAMRGAPAEIAAEAIANGVWWEGGVPSPPWEQAAPGPAAEGDR